MIEFTKKVKKRVPFDLSKVAFIVEIRISNSKIHKQNEGQNSNLLFHLLKYEIKS